MGLMDDVGFMDFFYQDDYIWFCDIFFGRLLKINIRTNTIFFENWITPYASNSKMQYGMIQIVNNDIILIPYNATKILVYDGNLKTFKSIMLKEYGTVFKKPLFLSMCRYEDDIILIPGRYPAIVKINIYTYDIVYYTQWVDDCLPLSIRSESIIFNSNAIMVGENLIVQKANSDFFLKLNIVTGKHSMEQIDVNGFYALASLIMDNKIICAGFSKKILLIDTMTCEVEWISKYDNALEPKQGFGQLIQYGDRILAISINQPCIYTISIKNKKIEKWIEFEYGCTTDSKIEMFTNCDIVGAKICENSLIMYSTIRNSIIMIDLKSKKISYFDHFKTDKPNMKDYVNSFLKSKMILSEEILKLENYVEIIKG